MVRSTFVPDRFQASRATLWIDRIMTQFIKVGGLIVIVAVFAIFVFILAQIIPLFRGARVKEVRSVQLPDQHFIDLGLDEWGELPVLIGSDGKISFVDLVGDRGTFVADPGFTEKKDITAFQYIPQMQRIVFGASDGTFAVTDINYSANFAGKQRTITENLKTGPFYSAGHPGFPIKQISYADSGDSKLAVVIQDANGSLMVSAATLSQTQGLMGAGEIAVGKSFDLTPKINGRPEQALVSMSAADVVIRTDRGEIYYFVSSGEGMNLRQVFKPFGDLQDPAISSMKFLFGGVSLVLSGNNGVNRVFSLYQKEGVDERLFGQTKQFDSLPGPPAFLVMSNRNKTFLIGGGSFASLRYSTTESIRWEQQLPFQATCAAIGSKYDRIAFVDKGNKLHLYSLSDPHPESGFKSIFGKIWYEGAPAPAYTWQSTGGSDDFEPKLSMVPLIFGTLKGTFYAMIFSLPLAILAAVYTSQFLAPGFRAVVKPTMEIMASLPSVVLGFLAALWLAPVIETRVPSVALVAVTVPVMSMAFGWLWTRLPIRIRVRVKPGYEWLYFLPVLLIVAYTSWNIGGLMERTLFVVKDSATGAAVADFRLWWTQVTGLPFEQRNSLVVGFMMGFAVIPIVFTIAEDALSNVPAALRSASLALGASRWQTAVRITLPTASAGIFSAIMIGLGRAVGETMIVVMATGNTPIMGFNIFSGMRTLSANIAVELPEAPVHSTLYRSLFLGAMALFLMTFVVNTIAEILRQHLREKYKTV